MAKAIADGARSVGAKVELYQVPELLSEAALDAAGARGPQQEWAELPFATEECLRDADAIIFGSPVRFGNVTAQMRNFLDRTARLWLSGALVGKVGSAFVSAGTQHGGHETAIQSMHTTLLYHGMYIVGLPYTEPQLVAMDAIVGGSPFGASFTTGTDGSREMSQADIALCQAQGKRVALIAHKISSRVATRHCDPGLERANLSGKSCGRTADSDRSYPPLFLFEMSHQDDTTIARRGISHLDLTELGDKATDADVVALCARAHGPHGNTAAVCVWPRSVPAAKTALHGTPIKVATVVNFPSGDEPVAKVVADTQRTIADGADEVDLVIPYKSFKRGETQPTVEMIAAVRAAVPANRTLKVILETGELQEAALIASASRIAIEQGANFIKTSTGKSPVSATLAATEIMLNAIKESHRPVGLKPSGGIRTLADARHYLEQADAILGPAWATPATFRFGASGLLTALQAALQGNSTVVSHAAY
ncbi:putative Deoxyribose-phosphate aldolase [Paratrimastix pyriformis]|uniref:deoxyribose-phosphate aldolase n=1 Tax=Paratrimastix pyriformis TaxID=342808 RepID=A0ABQ8ULX1_9EUKA|nr:putative Deoxyribose-phosphate aldolase [Paratrimastix pyriformis]